MTGRLSGRVVAVTREGDLRDPLASALRAEGAAVLAWPTLAFGEPDDPAPLAAAMARRDHFEWLAFTSPRAVEAVAVGCPWRQGRTRVAAVGEATADALREAGWPVHVAGRGGGAVALARAMAEDRSLVGSSVLFLAGSMARRDLERELSAAGARVERVEAYSTRVVPPDGTRVREEIEKGVSAVLFASPSAVRGLALALDGALAQALEGVRAVAIGDTTAEALAQAGLTGVEVAEESSMAGLAAACVKVLNPE